MVVIGEGGKRWRVDWEGRSGGNGREEGRKRGGRDGAREGKMIIRRWAHGGHFEGESEREKKGI